VAAPYTWAAWTDDGAPSPHTTRVKSPTNRPPKPSFRASHRFCAFLALRYVGQCYQGPGDVGEQESGEAGRDQRAVLGFEQVGQDSGDE
jgi:hypothetical protein